MSKMSINIGNSANDGNGEPARSAFNKTNKNFDEIYSYLGNGQDLNKVPFRDSENTWSKTQVFLGNGAIKSKGQFASVDLISTEGTGVGVTAILENAMGNACSLIYRDENQSGNGQIYIYFPRTGGTLALTTSDERIKNKIGQVDESLCLQRLSQLELWNYTLKPEMSANSEIADQKKRGFMAQQAFSVDETYGIPPNSEKEFWGIDDRAIIADLVGAIRMLKAEIDQLKGSSYEPQQ